MNNNLLAKLETKVITNRHSKPLLRKLLSDNMGGQFLNGPVLRSIRTQSLSDLEGDTIFIFGPGVGNDLFSLPPSKHIRQIVGIDITDEYKDIFLKVAANLHLVAHLEVGHVSDSDFLNQLLAKYGHPQAIIISFVLCCIRHPETILQALKGLLDENGHFFIIEHVADLQNYHNLQLQQQAQPSWLEITGCCNVCMDLGYVLTQAGLVTVEAQYYRHDGLLLELAAIQLPVLFVKARV